MLKIEHTEVVGWEHVIRGMRNPMNSWEKSDSSKCLCPGESPDCSSGYCVGPNDYDLMTRLREAGTDHRKFMRMIVVYLDITAPLYWWKEFDTYKVGTVANSCSTMHKIHAKEFTVEDFSHEHLIGDNDENVAWGNYLPRSILEIIVMTLNQNRDKFLECSAKLKRDDLTEAERKHVVARQKKVWWQMIQLLPTSYNQKRTVMLNYEVLANIYKSRRNHKLDEWHTLCDWIESLPYSELITGKKGE